MGMVKDTFYYSVQFRGMLDEVTEHEAAGQKSLTSMRENTLTAIRLAQDTMAEYQQYLRATVNLHSALEQEMLETIHTLEQELAEVRLAAQEREKQTLRDRLRAWWGRLTHREKKGADVSK